MSKTIQCQIVVCNDGSTIIECLESILQSTFTDIVPQYVIIDNCSNDGSIQAIRNRFKDKVEIITLDENIGFAGGHNYGINYALEKGCEFIAVLNPDLLLEKDCIQNLVNSLSVDKGIGISCPKLYRTTPEFKKSTSSIDASGMYFIPSMRHLDRTETYESSTDEPADRYNKPEYVIGASGAAFVISKECVQAVSFPTGLIGNKKSCLFDPDFFVYREDAELALRMHWLGWKTIYQPKSIGYHKRFVRPNNRNDIPERFNRMSVRNRFLFQINDLSLGAFLLTFPYAFSRNLLVIFGCLLKERSSLPGIQEVWKLRTKAWVKRRWIMNNAKNSTLSFVDWFKKETAFLPALDNNKNKKPEKLLVVLINYHQSIDLANALNALINVHLRDTKIEIKVVNNSPLDTGLNYLKDIVKNVVFLEPNKNLGFSGAINYATFDSDFDVLLILNPDIVISSDAIESCLDQFSKHQNLGALSPLLVDNESHEIQRQYTAKKLPRLVTIFSELPGFKKIFPRNPFINFQFYYDDHLTNQSIEQRKGLVEVEQLAGACLFTRKEAFESVGKFNESYYPAWHEDVDYSKKLFDSRWVSAVNCESTVTHIGGTSTSSIKNEFFISTYYKNYLRYWNIHKRGITRITGNSLILLTYSIKRLFLIDFKGKTVLGSTISAINDIINTALFLINKK